MTAAEFVSAMADPIPAPRRAVCCRCRNWTYAPIPVRCVPCPSGAGITLYACPSHAVFFGVGPTPEDEMNIQ